MTEVKRFGELTREEQLDLFEYWLDGGKIETLFCGESWLENPSPAWFGGLTHRKAVTEDYIDWSQVSPEWRYMARDETGQPLLYVKEPSMDPNNWLDLAMSAPVTQSSYKEGTVGWQDSLVKRGEDE